MNNKIYYISEPVFTVADLREGFRGSEPPSALEITMQIG